MLCTAGAFDLLITGDMAASTERELIAAYGLPDKVLRAPTLMTPASGVTASRSSSDVENLLSATWRSPVRRRWGRRRSPSTRPSPPGTLLVYLDDDVPLLVGPVEGHPGESHPLHGLPGGVCGSSTWRR